MLEAGGVVEHADDVALVVDALRIREHRTRNVDAGKGQRRGAVHRRYERVPE
jgi:hypothetical protein